MSECHYYVEYGGGLGDIFQQMYAHGTYTSLQALRPDEGATVTLITHNPFAPELFANHPKRAQLQICAPGYWLPEHDSANRRRLSLPPFSSRWLTRRVRAAARAPDVLSDGRRRGGDPDCERRGPTGGTADRRVRGERRRAAQVAAAAARGADCRRRRGGRLLAGVRRPHLRAQLPRRAQGFSAGLGVELVDRLTVPGTAQLVQEAAGVVCCHSSISMLAWMERKPVLLLYPDSTSTTRSSGLARWALGIDYTETVPRPLRRV